MPAERREALLDEWERGGTSAPEFCRLAGLNYATFAGWRARRQRQRQAPAMRTAAEASATAEMRLPNEPARRPALPFLQAIVDQPAPVAAGLRVELPGGARLWLESAGQLPLAAELLRHLAQPERLSC